MKKVICPKSHKESWQGRVLSNFILSDVFALESQSLGSKSPTGEVRHTARTQTVDHSRAPEFAGLGGPRGGRADPALWTSFYHCYFPMNGIMSGLEL